MTLDHAALLAILERNEWTYGGGYCSACHGLMPGEQWQFHHDRPHANGKPRRRYYEAELGHAPECPRANLMRDLGGEPVLRLQPPNPETP